MIARFAELGGGQGPLGDRPPELWAKKFLRLWASRDIDALMDLYAEDFERIDDRTLGRGESTKADLRKVLQSFFAAVSEIWWQVDEVLACDDRAIAVTATIHGRGADGGGPFEIPLGVVAVTENGRRTREYACQPEDRDAMLARFAEWSGEP